MNLNPINDEGQQMLAASILEITNAVREARAHISNQIPRLSAREFDLRYQDLRAYLGTIAEANNRVIDLLMGDPELLASEGLLIDACPPGGILVTDEVALARTIDRP